MKITVTRTFESITREVNDCRKCPFYKEEVDGNATLQICEHPKFGSGGYDNVIPDITFHWKNSEPKISKRCPYRPKPVNKLPEVLIRIDDGIRFLLNKDDNTYSLDGTEDLEKMHKDWLKSFSNNNDELIVYKNNQCKIKYLLEIK